MRIMRDGLLGDDSVPSCTARGASPRACIMCGRRRSRRRVDAKWWSGCLRHRAPLPKSGLSATGPKSETDMPDSAIAGTVKLNHQLVRLPAGGMRGPCQRMLLAERKQIRLGMKRGDRAVWKRDNQLGKVLPHCSDSTALGRTGDPAIRQRLLDCNEDDCEATAVLLDGIRALQRPPIDARVFVGGGRHFDLSIGEITTS